MVKKQTKQQVQSEDVLEEEFNQDSYESISRSRNQGVPIATQTNSKSQSNKKRKITKSQNRNRQDNNSEQNQPNSKIRNFQCRLCDRYYGSPAATHTHIDKKHPEHRKNKKKFIINLNNVTNEQRRGKYSGIRMKDIDYPEMESGCMENADLTLFKIYNHAKDLLNEKDKKQDGRVQILISENDTDFFQDISLDVKKANKVPTQRDLEIYKQFNKSIENYKITELRQRVKNYYEFTMFHERKFDLELEQELMKFFKVEFAAKVKVQLQITAALERFSNSVVGVKELTKNKQTTMDAKFVQNMLACERQMWKGEEVIMQQIKNYYREWVCLTSKYLRNMMESENALEQIQSKEAADGSYIFEDML